MGRCYHYPPGSRATLDARAQTLAVPIRVTESNEVVEVLLDDGPWVLVWERNQPVSATLIESVPDGSPSRLLVEVPATAWAAILNAKATGSTAEIVAAIDAAVVALEVP